MSEKTEKSFTLTTNSTTTGHMGIPVGMTTAYLKNVRVFVLGTTLSSAVTAYFIKGTSGTTGSTNLCGTMSLAKGTTFVENSVYNYATDTQANQEFSSADALQIQIPAIAGVLSCDIQADWDNVPGV